MKTHQFLITLTDEQMKKLRHWMNSNWDMEMYFGEDQNISVINELFYIEGDMRIGALDLRGEVKIEELDE